MQLMNRSRTIPVGSSTLRRRILGLLVLIAACWGVLLAAAPDPSGDPVLVSASPADGEFVKSPDEVRLTFDQAVPAELATVRMTKPNGEQVVDGRPYHPSGDSDTIAVRMPVTRYVGTYSVAWSLPSTRSEPLSGTFSFAVFSETNPVRLPVIETDRDQIVAGVYTVTRLVAISALVLGVGLAFILAVAWPAGLRHALVRRLLKYGWWALVIATLGTLVSFGGYAARTSLGDAFDPALLTGTFESDIGAALLARLLVLVPVTVGLVLLLTSRPPDTAAERWSAAGAVLGASAALAVTWSLARSHDPDEPSALTLGADIALLLAVAVSVGGPVLLWILLRGTGDPVLRDVVPRLTRVMPVSGGLLLAIAVTAASGWEMVALIVLAALVIGTGLANRGWARRIADTRGKDLPGHARLRRVAAVAVVVGAVALVVAVVTANGESQLALTGWPPGGDQEIGSQSLDIR